MANERKISISSSRATTILNALHLRCLQASVELGEEMGFEIDKINFVVDPLPKEITSIDFEFNVTLLPT